MTPRRGRPFQRRARGIASGMVCVIVSLASPTWAAPPAMADKETGEPSAKELEAARLAFKAGLEAEKAGDYATALAKFEFTAKIRVTPQVRFHLALCNDKVGKLKLAAYLYDLAAKEAQATGAKEVLDAAPLLAQRARVRLAVLTIVWKGETPKSFSVDDVPEDPAEAGKGMVLDPGRHVIAAGSPGSKEVRLEVTLAEKEEKSVDLVIAPPPPPPVKPVAGPVGPGPAVDSAGSARRLRTTGLIVSTAGAVSLGLGAVFLLVRASAVSDLEKNCSSDMRCPPSQQGTYDRAKTFTTLSRVALGVGVLAVGAGAYLYLTSGKDESKTGYVRLAPGAPDSHVGVGLEGAF